MKLKTLLAAGIVLALFANGCERREKPRETADGRLFGVTFQTMNNPFFVELNEGIRQVVEAHGDRLITLDARWDSHKQRNDISDLILQEASCRPSAKAYRASLSMHPSGTKTSYSVRSRQTTSKPVAWRPAPWLRYAGRPGLLFCIGR